MLQRNNRKSCAGITIVEFSIIAGLFFIVLFGVIEMGRLLYTMNVLDEVTRRAARLAAVCPMDQTDEVKSTSVFDGEPVLPQLDATMLDIEYLSGAMTPITNISDVGSVRFVRAKINSNYQHRILIPFLYSVLTPPDFSTTLPSESLGITNTGDSVQC